MSPWSPGFELGPYILLAPIGEGGMGEVWKARDTRLDRIVAIKQLKAAHSSRFQQEARAIAALNHPHICQIYDVGPNYLVLEYVDGSPIKGPLPQADAIRVALQIAGALEAAHSKKILHRDLKPGNILMSATGAKLLDFGLAKILADEDATLSIGVAGTPLYMSPEQAEGKPLDARSDIFSFGSVLYELLAGRRAFDSLAAVLRDQPRPLGSFADGMQAILTRCLCKGAADRYANAADLRIALEALATHPTAQQPSIAVLPFSNMSGDKEQEYFSDGLAEEIINALVKVPGLNVTARTSAFAFRGKEQDITKIAEALRVRTILEGSVRRSGNRIRVTAQLINAEDGYHVWSDRYDRELTDVFAIQDEISQAICGALQGALSVGPKPSRQHTPAMAAYEAYLRGRHHLARHTLEGMERAREFFDQAVALDPNYAEPHAALGEVYQTFAIEGARIAPDVIPSARAEARKALLLNPLDLNAQALLGCIAAIYDFDWPEAERIRTTLGDNYSGMAAFLGIYYLSPRDRIEELIEVLKLALQQDPLHALLRTILGHMLSKVGRHEEGLAEVRKILEIDEGHYFAHYCVGRIYAYQGGHMSEALESAERCYQLAPWHPRGVGFLAALSALTGEQSRADSLIGDLQSAGRPGIAMGMIEYHLVRDAPEAALEWFEKAVQQREPLVVVWLSDPRVEPIKSSPRWAALLRSMNLA